MQCLKELKLTTKIIVFISVMAVFLGLVGFVGYSSTVKISKYLDFTYNQSLLPVKWLNEVRTYSRAGEAVTLDLLNPANKDKDKEQKNLAEAKKISAKIDELVGMYTQTKLEGFQKDKLLEYQEEVKAYRVERQKAIDMALSGQKNEAYQYFVIQAVPHLGKLNAVLAELADFNSQQAEKYNEKAQKDASAATRAIGTVSLVAIIIAFTVGLWFARFNSIRLMMAVDMLNEVAKGNFDIEERTDFAGDELGQMGKNLQAMVQNLRHLIKQVAVSAEHVAASSQQLTASSDQSAQAANQVAESISDVASGANRQLTSVEEASAVIEEIVTGIEQVAVNACSVAETTHRTASASVEGEKAIDDAINQMNTIQKTVVNSAEVVTKLGERSKEIGSIVDTISGIAGQTNLLALNAAIEAARAGEQGRGFAVVAEEVRKLAEQSQEAAKKIASLIHEIQGDTDNAVLAMNEGTNEVIVGEHVVASAGQAFKEIAGLIADVSTQVDQINNAIEKVANGSEQILIAIQSINQISKDAVCETQTVSAATEEQSASMQEIASSSRSLVDMAEELQIAISKFKI